MMLIEPTMEYARQIRAYRQKFLACGDSMDGTGGLRNFEDPAEWIAYLSMHKDPSRVPVGRVPSRRYAACTTKRRTSSPCLMSRRTLII